jgi:hypothetical protein
MPAAVHYADTWSPDYREQRQRAEQEWRARRAISATNWNSYNGQHKKFLKTTKDGLDDNMILNLLRQIVDRRVAFLFPELPILILDEGDANSPDETWLNHFWGEMGGATLLANMALNGAVDGQVYVRVVPGNPPKILNISSANVIVWWEADNYQNILWYEMQWADGNGKYRQDIVKDNLNWLIRDFKMDGGDWRLLQEEQWRFTFAPIVTWQHLPNPMAFYGRHEFENAALNDSFNFVASNINRILRFHAHPRTIVTGASAKSLEETAANQLWSIASPDAKVHNLEMQGDLGSSMKFLEFIRGFIFDTAAITVMPTDVKAFGDVTNFGIRAAFMPMLSVNEMLRRQYGKAIESISQAVLALSGRAVWPIRLSWPDPLPVDAHAVTEILKQQIDAGLVSQETAMQELRRNPVIERQRMIAETEIAAERLERTLIQRSSEDTDE